jgi:hypothetical protein
VHAAAPARGNCWLRRVPPSGREPVDSPWLGSGGGAHRADEIVFSSKNSAIPAAPPDQRQYRPEDLLLGDVHVRPYP